MTKYHGKITYTIDKNHPDIEYLKDYTEKDVFTYEDTYTFNESYSKGFVAEYVKRDLMLVAGGGYNTDHIHNVKFEIKRA